MTYSLDFRKKVLSVRNKRKLSFAQVAKRFDISVNSVFLWSKKLEPKQTKNRPEIKIDRKVLIEDIKKYPDAYNYERAQPLKVSNSGIYCAIKRLQIRHKKNIQSPQSLRKRRQTFREKIAKYENFGRTIIYIDENAFAHDRPRTHGYSKIGHRCFGTHDWGVKGRTNAIGALFEKRLLTLSLFNCNINTETFSLWMQEKIKVAGHTLEYLSPYSPDLNPIEHKWAQAKAKRRKYQCGIDELFKEYCL